MFTVSQELVALFSPNGMLAATIKAEPGGAAITSRSSEAALTASLGAVAASAGLRVREGNVLRLESARQRSGNYSLKVPSLTANGEPLAGLGESRAGTGALVVADAAGHVKASMSIVDNRGSFGIYSAQGAAILSLTEAKSGAGLLAIGDASGEPLAKMGVKDDRYGVVLTGPRAGFPLVTGSGMPGSYFMGCAGGGACKP